MSSTVKQDHTMKRDCKAERRKKEAHTQSLLGHGIGADEWNKLLDHGRHDSCHAILVLEKGVQEGAQVVCEGGQWILEGGE